MGAALDLLGQVFGKLVVVSRSHKDNTGAWMWLCRCECAHYVHVRGATLKAGRTLACKSCAAVGRSTTHGATGTDLYSRWRAMLDRCENRKHRAWANYGGRGIKVCADWHRFEAFSSDMGAAFRSELELDRIDVNGDYRLGNCRWSTRIEQQRNRRNNHLITWCGHTRTVYEWAEALGVKPNTLLYRIRRGWDLDRAMTRGVADPVLLELANS